VKLEREAKLEVEPGFRMPDLSTALGELRTENGGTERFVSTYHDTDDFRLARWGASIHYRAAEGWTVRLPRAGGEPEVWQHTFRGSPGRAPADAVDLVRGIVRGGVLEPVARVQTVRRRHRVVHGAPERVVAEVVDDEDSVLEGRRIVQRFRELEIELADDASDMAMGPILMRLTDLGARAAEPAPKVERALGARAFGSADVVVPSVGPTSSVAEVIGWAIAVSLTRLIAHDAIVRLGDDPEGVHQARVATRRLRSDLRIFRPMLDRTWRDRLHHELGWLGGELGRVRDLDVLSDRLLDDASLLSDDDAAGAAEVLERLKARRGAARIALLSAMREPRYVALLDALVDACEDPGVAGVGGAVGATPAIDVLGGVIKGPWARLAQRCDELGPHAPDHELHAARIGAKRVRYAAETLIPVFGKPAKRFARRAEALQQVLGSHQDAVMAIAWLREQAEGLPPGVAFLAGRLAGIEEAVRDDARAAWPDAWADLRRKRLRFWQ